MAQVFDMAQIAADRLDRANTQVSVLPSERQCDYDGLPMTLVQIEDEQNVLRIHTCPDKECGFTKRYGGVKGR